MELSGIQNKIYEIRGQRVMLDRDLVELYQVTTGALNQAVKRNSKRFPADFMSQLTNQEFANLKSQIVISSWGGIRKIPYAFTEQGVSMLSAAQVHPDDRIQKEQITVPFGQFWQSWLTDWQKTGAGTAFVEAKGKCNNY